MTLILPASSLNTTSRQFPAPAYPTDGLTADPTFIGRAPKTGCETTAKFTGFETSIYAEAISADGQVLGRSAAEATMKPSIRQSRSQSVENLYLLENQLISADTDRLVNYLVYTEESYRM
jgi:hypothetical protein